MQTGNTAADAAQEQGHGDVAELMMARTDRTAASRSASAAQTSTAPSAPPLPASQYSISPRQSTTRHQSPSQRQSQSAAATTAPANRRHAVSYPTIFASTSSSSHGTPQAEGIPANALAAGSLQQEDEEGFGSAVDSRQAHAVQADVPALGYMPGALSFMITKLQVLPICTLLTCITNATVITAVLAECTMHLVDHSSLHSHE